MKVLIVDDCTFTLKLLSFMLDDLKYTYAKAEDGLQACSIIDHDCSVDVVLMDVNLPGLDGISATKKIRASHPERLLQVLFISSLDDDEMLANCLKAGGDDFIPKPVNKQVLTAKLQSHYRLISMYRLLQENNNTLKQYRYQMDRELDILDCVFRNAMSRNNTDCRNITFHLSPMSMFNGDLLLIAPSPTKGVYVLLGDFTGHGLSAAIGCLPVSDIFFELTEKHVCVGDIAAEFNARLKDLLPCNMFFCAALIELSHGGERISVWSGGMNDLYLVNAEGDIEERMQSMHMPLGILDDREFERDIKVLHPPLQSHLFVYTDGVVEACNPEGDYFGAERLESSLLQNTTNSVDTVVKELETFKRGAGQDDDTSMVEILCCPVSFQATNRPESISLPAPAASNDAALPIELSVTLTLKQIRSGDVVKQLLDPVVSIPEAKRHKDLLYILLAELYNNAVEHGLLMLDTELKKSADGLNKYNEQRAYRLKHLKSGEVSIKLSLLTEESRKPSYFNVRISDTGPGFDHQTVIERLECGDASYGRGLSLVKSLSSEVRFSNEGRTIEVTYLLD